MEGGGAAGGAGGEGGVEGGGEKLINVGAVKISTVTPRALCVRCGSEKSALTSVTSVSAWSTATTIVTLTRMEAGSTATVTSDALTLSSVASEAPKAVASKVSTVPEATKDVMSMRPCV